MSKILPGDADGDQYQGYDNHALVTIITSEKELNRTEIRTLSF